MFIDKLTTEQLEAELAKRKAAPSTAPVPLEKMDFSNLIKCVTDRVSQCFDDGVSQCFDEDFSHYVYEEAMKAVYGDGYFAWRNAQKW